MLESEYFEKLWSKEFDDMILEAVNEQLWFWKHKLADDILDTFTYEERDEWWNNDPVIIAFVKDIYEKYNDDNSALHAHSHQWSIVDNYIDKRVTKLNCLKNIREPRAKTCKRCNLVHRENEFQAFLPQDSRLKI